MHRITLVLLLSTIVGYGAAATHATAGGVSALQRGMAENLWSEDMIANVRTTLRSKAVTVPLFCVSAFGLVVICFDLFTHIQRGHGPPNALVWLLIWPTTTLANLQSAVAIPKPGPMRWGPDLKPVVSDHWGDGRTDQTNATGAGA